MAAMANSYTGRSGKMGEASFALTPFVLVALLLTHSTAQSAWLDPAWKHRRTVDLDAAATGDELVTAEFHTLGLHESSGENIRVAADDGKPVPARVLMLGPGDKMRVVFAPVRGAKRYYVYFGHPKPPAAPRNLDDVPMRGGVLMEMRRLAGPLSINTSQMERTWERSRVLVGRTMLARLFIGHNPFGDEVQVMSKYSASLNVPADGEYTFAGSASDRAGLFIDGKPLLWIPAVVGDVRFSAKIDLKRGRHDLILYHENIAGEQRISIVWKRPDSKNFDLIPAGAFGTLARAGIGPLQENGKPLIADMRIDYQGESFFADHYSHRYRFTAMLPPEMSKGTFRYEWDFGDGQTATGASVDHVFLVDGEHAVKLSVKSATQNDARTNRLVVSRLYEHIDNPPNDPPIGHAKVVAGYDIARLTPKALPVAVLLLERSRDPVALEKAAIRLAGMGQTIPVGTAVTTLASAADELCTQGKFDAAARIWEAVPAGSPFYTESAKHYGRLLMWRLGDFRKTAGILEPLSRKDPNDRVLRRNFAHALILSGRASEGMRMLQNIIGDGPPDRQGALSGAMARTIEYYIRESDWEAGEAAWERWQQQYPADFLEGYSVLLRTKLLESAKAPLAAAKVAEAFALAMPKSSYAPTLLDRASKLLAASDPTKSRSLRELLKKNYPEDPLSQDK